MCFGASIDHCGGVHELNRRVLIALASTPEIALPWI
jgi:hypothetical protein